MTDPRADPQARFQRALLPLLASGAAPEAIRQALAQDPSLADLKDYVATLDPRALTVAAQLVATWGKGDRGG